MPFTVPHCCLRDASTHQTDLEHAFGLVVGELNASNRELYSHSGRWLGNLPLPSFQREACWERDRQVAFLESAFLGISLGNYVVNTLWDWTDPSMAPKGGFHPFHELLIDGQQRLGALRAYFLEEFPVFGAYWGELSIVERRRFHRTTFTKIEVHLTDEAALRDLYNRMAFGGVTHKQSERA